MGSCYPSRRYANDPATISHLIFVRQCFVSHFNLTVAMARHANLWLLRHIRTGRKVKFYNFLKANSMLCPLYQQLDSGRKKWWQNSSRRRMHNNFRFAISIGNPQFDIASCSFESHWSAEKRKKKSFNISQSWLWSNFTKLPLRFHRPMRCAQLTLFNVTSRVTHLDALHHNLCSQRKRFLQNVSHCIT